MPVEEERPRDTTGGLRARDFRGSVLAVTGHPGPTRPPVTTHRRRGPGWTLQE